MLTLATVDVKDLNNDGIHDYYGSKAKKEFEKQAKLYSLVQTQQKGMKSLCHLMTCWLPRR